MAWHDTRQAMLAFVDRYGLDFEHGVDETDAIFGGFGFFYQPGWAFVNDDGAVQTHSGALTPESLRERLDGLISA